MTSVVVRHGRTDPVWEALDYASLTAYLRGEVQLPADPRFLAGLDLAPLAERGIERIFSSTRQRAVETAEFFSEALGAPVELEPRLDELLLDGLPEAVFERGPQAIRSFLVGMCAELPVSADTLAWAPARGALLVSHGFAMRGFFRQRFEVPISSLLQDARFVRNCGGFCLATGDEIQLAR